MNIPTSITPGISLTFCASDFGFFITPKSQSKITLPFSVMKGYPRSIVRIFGFPPRV